MIVDAKTFLLSKHPAFIAFEGINGCGKTTLLQNVLRGLEDRKIPALRTREPGGTPLGAELRRLLLEWPGETKSDRTELLLFAADRAEHVEKIIKPKLRDGVTILCDRYIYSTITFQGHGRGIGRQIINEANALAVQGTLPDLVVLLDLAPDTALQRIAKRQGNGTDAFEAEEISFHTRIREGFLEIAEFDTVPFLVLDANRTADELTTTVISIISGEK